MNNPTTVSEDCSAVAFYGFTPSLSKTKALYEEVLKWFKAIGCSPDRIGVGAPGFSEKLVSFSRAHNKLVKRGFEGVDMLEVIASTAEPETGHDYLAKTSYDAAPESLNVDMVARSSLCSLKDHSMLPFARQVIRILRPSYGIGFTREHRLGPELYTIGINFGVPITGLSDEQYEAKRTISRWLDVGMKDQVYNQGLLRDVYPWNFLSSPQLTRDIQGVPLERWICEKPNHGKMSSLDGEMVLWEVEESQIPGIRSALQAAGVIFDWRTFQGSTPI